MTAATVSRSPDFQAVGTDVPRDLFPTGRIKFSLGVGSGFKKRGAEIDRRMAALKNVRNWGAWDILHAISTNKLEVGTVCRQVARGGEGALAEIRRDLDRVRVGAVPTFKAEVERYLAWFENHRGELSLLQRKHQLAQFGRQHRYTDVTLIDDVSLDAITKADVESAIAAISANANTRESIRTAVSGLYTWSIRDEAESARVDKRLARWNVNPASLVASVPGQARVATASTTQVQALLAAAEIYQEAYLRAFLHLGLREGELIHTRLHLDLDLETWLWRIQKRGYDRRCSCRKCQGRGWSPKTRLSNRELLVPADTAHDASLHPLRFAILKYLDLYPAEAGDFVFRNPRTGGVWNARTLLDDFKSLCARAGVANGRNEPGGLTPHVLRHTCATDLVRQGVRESVIAAILGDTIQTIFKFYINLTAADLSNGIARGSVYLNGGRP